MSFWLQVVYYTTLLSLTPLDMWGFIANCTSQAGIPSSSMAVHLIAASTLLGLLVPLLLPRMGALASFCGLLPLGAYVLCAFNQEALDDCCVAAMQKES